MSQHHPIQGASWMLTAGLAFAVINSLTQIASIHFGLTSTTVAVIQYAIALLAILPYLKTLGIRRALKTDNLKLHVFRVFLSVIGIQLWIWALAYPVPIWQGIALLMTSPLFATIGSGLFLKEKVGAARWGATLARASSVLWSFWNHGQKILAGQRYCLLALHSFGRATL